MNASIGGGSAVDLVCGADRWPASTGPVRIGSDRTCAIRSTAPGIPPTAASVEPILGGGWLVRSTAPGRVWFEGTDVATVPVGTGVTIRIGGGDGPALTLSTAPAAPSRPAPDGTGPRPGVPGPARPDRSPGSTLPPGFPGPSMAPPPRSAGPATRFSRVRNATPVDLPPRGMSPPGPVPGSSGPPARSHGGSGATAPLGGSPVAPGPPSPTPTHRPRIVTIGRAADRDVVVPDLLAARHHAELRWNGRGWDLLDLGSPTGVMVDGVRRGSGPVADGARLTFGTKSYLVGRHGLTPFEPTSDRGATPALRASGIVVEVDGGTRILDDISIDVGRGELVAIVGPSGSGKSTFLKALTGSRRPESGTVEVRGLDLYESYDELCRTIGYVPQDDILHLPLTIREALEFGAELRFPAETTPEDRRERVDEVLAELELAHRANVPIEKISGGQRKRTSVALELLTRPDLLFLDEPTSGLDPGFERTVMELLRNLASGDRSVVVVTHSLQSLELCDRVLFLAPGGHIAFFGPPDEALRWFGKDDFIDVFRDLEALPGHHWAARTGGTAGRAVSTPPRVHAGTGTVRPGQPWKRQVEILARRQVAILRADRQNLMFLVGGVVVPAILILLLMGSDTLRLGQREPVVARTILGAVTVAAVAIGAANSIREIVKEMPIYLRERAVGLRRSAYLTSKILVLGALTAVQAAVLVIIATLRSGGPGRANLLLIPHLELIVVVASTGLAAVGLGLLLSTMVSSSEKAMALVPVIFVVQWLFSGAALDLQAKPIMRDVAKVTAANWGMAASASTVDEHALSMSCSEAGRSRTSSTSSDPWDDGWFMDESGGTGHAARGEAVGTCDARWAGSIGNWVVSMTALGILTVLPIAAADRLLARREPLEAQRAPDWPFNKPTDAAGPPILGSLSSPLPPGAKPGGPGSWRGP